MARASSIVTWQQALHYVLDGTWRRLVSSSIRGYATSACHGRGRSRIGAEQSAEQCNGRQVIIHATGDTYKTLSIMYSKDTGRVRHLISFHVVTCIDNASQEIKI